MFKRNVVAVAVLALSPCAWAQQATVGGGQLQQIPPAPVPERAAPEIRIDGPNVPLAPASDNVKVVVKSLRIAGAKVYSEPALVAASGFKSGSELSLVDLRWMATKVTNHYHRNGYFVARAYLPAQDIKDGIVTLNVVEGEYGTVRVRNQSTLSDARANAVVAGLNSGDAIAIGPLENRLLRLSDTPGVTGKSTLVPGASVGTSDLIVDVTPGQRWSGSAEADNAGNRYTGRYRVGGTVNLNNPTGHGDVVTLRGLTSGEGLAYGRLSYQTQVGDATVGVAYTYLQYHLGREFGPLDAHGEAHIGSVFASYPLIRSRNTNLYVVGGFDYKTFEDKVDATSTVTDKNVQVGMLGLHGNSRDDLWGGGYNTYSVTGFAGNVDIRTPAALAADAATARSNGGYGKLAYSAARLQTVTQRISIYGAVYGQVASKNLDISEKMVLGGPYGVRAYPVGEAYGDEGYVATLEGRFLLPSFSPQVPGQVYASVFVDTGTVRTNEEPWSPGPNTRTLSGAGVGLTWSEYNNFVVRASYAHKLGNAPAVSAPDSSGQYWLQLVKYF